MAYLYGDENNPIEVDILTEKFNSKKMGKAFQGSSWFILHYLHIPLYYASEDFEIQLHWKNTKSDPTFLSISYPVSKDENTFKQRLPNGIVGYEWQVRIIGVFTTQFDFHGILIDADPYLTGARG